MPILCYPTGLLGLAYSDGVHGQRLGRRGRQQFRRGRNEAAPPGGYTGASAPADSYAAGGDQATYNDAGAIDNYAAASDASQATYNGDSAADAAAAELAALEANIPGIPGEDYPIYAEVPETAFACDGQVDGGKFQSFFLNSCVRRSIESILFLALVLLCIINHYRILC